VLADAGRPAPRHAGEAPPDDERLQLVFSGQCLAGHDPLVVREALTRALKLDEERAARLFSGKPIVMRREVDVAAAHRHIARFAMLGAVLRAEPAKRRPLPPAAAAPPPAAAPTDDGTAVAPPGGLTWRGPLRWAGIATLGIGAGLLLGLLLGPGLGSDWPDAPPLRASPTTVAGTAAPTAAPAPPDETPADMTPQARQEHRQRYMPAPGHKAFAISAAGTHAWYSGAATDNDAREAALASCTAALPAGAPACRVVDADGEWLE